MLSSWKAGFCSLKLGLILLKMSALKLILMISKTMFTDFKGILKL